MQAIVIGKLVFTTATINKSALGYIQYLSLILKWFQYQTCQHQIADKHLDNSNGYLLGLECYIFKKTIFSSRKVLIDDIFCRYHFGVKQNPFLSLTHHRHQRDDESWAQFR